MVSLVTEGIAQPISISGIGVLSSLGKNVESHKQAISQGKTGIRGLSELFGKDSPYADLHGGWIEPRGLLSDRKWSPASMAALHVARQAVVNAKWNSSELANAGLVVGTSRGNAAGWLAPWPGRRPFKLMAASNTIHSEPATAVSIELGILGPNHVIASGCSAGLDAMGIAKLLIESGEVERVLVVAVDLPLVPLLLDGYASSGLLGSAAILDPYAASADGFLPAEGAAAIALSAGNIGSLRFSHFSNNSDGAGPVGIPKDGGRTPQLLEKAIARFGIPTALCPHATGTKTQAAAERFIFGKMLADRGVSLHLLKPYFGHTVGASGLLESAILLAFMEENLLPPNLPGISALSGLDMPAESLPCTGPVFKLAHGMGGHNALAVFQNIT